MYSKIKIFGHPLHPILVAYPIAFYTSAFVSFVLFAGNNSQFCYEFGYVSNIIGICSAALAALPGFIDWAVGIPAEIPAKSKGLKHMILNVVALSVFTANVVVQNKNYAEANITIAIILTGIGLLCTLFAGYIGGDLMQKEHVGINLSPEQEKPEPGIKK
jgi:uncharacterized membrane protein